MKVILARVFALFASVLLLAGCSSLNKIADIQVSILEIRPAGVSKTHADMTLRYTNGNVFPIAVSTTSHKLYLNGSYVGRVVSSEEVGLPQTGAATQKVTLLLERQIAVNANGPANKATYRIESLLRTEISDERVKIHAVSSGEVDVAALLGGAQK